MTNVPKLKLPQKDCSVVEAFKKGKDGPEGFGKKLMSIMMQQDQKSMPIPYKSSDSKAAMAKKACEAVNRRHEETRKAIDVRMQQYLLENGGKVDFWIDSVSVGQMGWKDIDYDDVRFDYFGDDYEVKKDGSRSVVTRKSKEFIYRNTYKAPDSPEFSVIHGKCCKAQQDMEKAQKEVSYVLVFLSFVAVVYLTYVFLSVLADTFFNVGKTFFEPLFYTWGLDAPGRGMSDELKNLVYILLGGPSYLHCMIKDGIGGPAGNKIYWILTVAALLFIALGILVCWITFAGCRDHNRAYKQARAAYLEIANSEEYHRIAAEDKEWKKESNALAEQWHRAWFDWVCAHKEYGGQSSVDAGMASVRGEIQAQKEREMRTKIKKEIGYDVPEEISAILWMQRFTQLMQQSVKKRGAKDYDELSREETMEVMEEILTQMAKDGLI